MPEASAYASVSALILAGGRGSRFGGNDKGWQLFHGKPLVAHAIQHLQPFSTITVSANRNLERYADLGLQVVTDVRPDYPGPLAGIESVLRLSRSAWWYVMPVDVLGMPGDWPLKLWEQAQKTDSPWVGTVAEDGRLQPLLGLWSASLLPDLQHYLQQGERRVMRFIEPWAEHALALPAGCQLLNLNSEQALLAAQDVSR